MTRVKRSALPSNGACVTSGRKCKSKHRNIPKGKIILYFCHSKQLESLYFNFNIWWRFWSMSNENISLSVLIVRLDSQCYTSCSTIHTQSAPVSDVLLIPPENDLSPNHLDLNQPSSSSSRTLMSQKTKQLAPRILQTLSKNVRTWSLSHFDKKSPM